VVSLVLDDHRHALADEVEGYLVDLLAGALDIEVLVGQDREVEEVAQPRLIVAVHPRVAQHVLAGPVRHIDVALESHLVLGDRARLVGAQDVHRAEVLYRLELLDDDLLARHEDRPLGEADGDDHRQHLGGEAHGDR